MSENQQPEEMRPIPDGGLKDAMPSWLKRPPAWRSMPSAEERHERTLPEPDTSEIDPKTLVDVSDLPLWLQTIASRGELPAPEPDQSVGHALEQIQAASSRSKLDPEDAEPEPVVEDDRATDVPAEVETPKAQEVGLLSDEPATSLPPTPGANSPPYLMWALGVCGVIIVALAILVLYLL